MCRSGRRQRCKPYRPEKTRIICALQTGLRKGPVLERNRRLDRRSTQYCSMIYIYILLTKYKHVYNINHKIMPLIKSFFFSELVYFVSGNRHVLI